MDLTASIVNDTNITTIGPSSVATNNRLLPSYCSYLISIIKSLPSDLCYIKYAIFNNTITVRSLLISQRSYKSGPKICIFLVL